MAPTVRRAAIAVDDRNSPAARLLSEGYAFGFFQAVRLLERLNPQRAPVGRSASPDQEVVRFRAHLSLGFPPSEIHEIVAAGDQPASPIMTIAFFGLTGPSGILPRHYTELLLRLRKEARFAEKDALRDWLDLFNHRLVSLFYRAWEKYRFYIPYERRDYSLLAPDTFTQCLLSLVGLGLPALRNRLKITVRRDEASPGEDRSSEVVLANVDDLSVLHYAGLFAHRPRTAAGLEAILNDYFQAPIRIRQFQGQWLKFEPSSQTRLGLAEGNSRLGADLVIGERVWDVQGKVRISVGPLRYEQFLDFLPDRAAVAQRKAFFLLVHLVRLYVGPELDFDVQLMLRSNEVPNCHLANGRVPGARLGWNSWLKSVPRRVDAGDAIFQGKEIYSVDLERNTQRWHP
jgi:type VI secretion system protein ImpH